MPRHCNIPHFWASLAVFGLTCCETLGGSVCIRHVIGKQKLTSSKLSVYLTENIVLKPKTSQQGKLEMSSTITHQRQITLVTIAQRHLGGKKGVTPVPTELPKREIPTHPPHAKRTAMTRWVCFLAHSLESPMTPAAMLVPPGGMLLAGPHAESRDSVVSSGSLGGAAGKHAKDKVCIYLRAN